MARRSRRPRSLRLSARILRPAGLARKETEPIPPETGLISTIAVGLALAFAGGFLASRLKLPPIVGYLLAGVAVGPFTPGFVADAGLAGQLAEIGVILLMFGVGIHFSIEDLLAVRRIVVPGALVQVAAATLMGVGITRLWGWSLGGGLVLGLALSVASTVVLLRSLEERGLLDSANGRIAVGWLIVQDLVMVLALVLLPALALPLGGQLPSPAGALGGESLTLALALTLGKVAAFVALMLFVGARAVPWLLEQVARSGSRELFTLSVLAVALGVAYGSAALFGVSFALGAFFAGVVLGESDLSQRAAQESLPMRDAFAVLFFVSVGMLFDPAVLLERPLQVLAVLAVILVGNPLAAFVIVTAFGYRLNAALAVSASLAQVGEFSFILAGLGLSLGLLPPEGRSLVLAGAILSITLNPLAFGAMGPVVAWMRAHPRLAARLEIADDPLVELPAGVDEARLRDHAVVVGFGRVGGVVGQALERHGVPYVIVEQDRARALALRARGLPVVYGDAAVPGILAHAHLEAARLLVVATPDALQAAQAIDLARRANPLISVVARTHSDEEQAHLERHGADRVLVGERELAVGMARFALRGFGVDLDELKHTVRTLRFGTAGRDPESDGAPADAAG